MVDATWYSLGPGPQQLFPLGSLHCAQFVPTFLNPIREELRQHLLALEAGHHANHLQRQAFLMALLFALHPVHVEVWFGAGLG